MADRGEQSAAAVVLAGEFGVGDRAQPEGSSVVDRVVAGVVVRVGRRRRCRGRRAAGRREERAGGRVVGAVAQPDQPVDGELAAVAQADAGPGPARPHGSWPVADGALPVGVQRAVAAESPRVPVARRRAAPPSPTSGAVGSALSQARDTSPTCASSPRASTRNGVRPPARSVVPTPVQAAEAVPPVGAPVVLALLGDAPAGVVVAVVPPPVRAGRRRELPGRVVAVVPLPVRAGLGGEPPGRVVGVGAVRRWRPRR